jgi:hypothetical protein
VTAKIVLDRLAHRYFTERGYGWEEVEEVWKRDRGAGFLKESNLAVLQERVDLLVPGFWDYFQEHSVHNMSYQQVLAHRARWTVLKDETRRFRGPEWKPFFQMVRDTSDVDKPITARMRHAAHEQIVTQRVQGQPGVYVNTTPDNPSCFYLGESDDVAQRNRGHRNGTMYLTRVYVTGSKGAAISLQNALFHRLEELDIISERRYPDAAVGRQGALYLADGINPTQVLDEIVSKNYREFCRATLGNL